MEALERRIGRRRNATRAPTQAPEWRGRLRPPRISNQTRRSITYCARKMVLTTGATFNHLPNSGDSLAQLLSQLPYLASAMGDFVAYALGLMGNLARGAQQSPIRRFLTL